MSLMTILLAVYFLDFPVCHRSMAWHFAQDTLDRRALILREDTVHMDCTRRLFSMEKGHPWLIVYSPSSYESRGWPTQRHHSRRGDPTADIRLWHDVVDLGGPLPIGFPSLRAYCWIKVVVSVLELKLVGQLRWYPICRSPRLLFTTPPVFLSITYV